MFGAKFWKAKLWYSRQVSREDQHINVGCDSKILRKTKIQILNYEKFYSSVWSCSVVSLCSNFSL